jgi:DNA-binding NarL/FixJ family response regulator
MELGATVQSLSKPPASAVTVAVVDSSEVVCLGLKALFVGDARFCHVDTFSRVAEAIGALCAPPRVVVGDLTDAQQLALLASEWPECPILIYSSSSQQLPLASQNLRGFLPKGLAPSWLVKDVAYLVATTACVLFCLQLNDPSTGLHSSSMTLTFSPRETQIISLLLKGLSDKEIAVALGLHKTTIHSHVGNILRKANASNRVQFGSLFHLAPNEKRAS